LRLLDINTLKAAEVAGDQHACFCDAFA